MLRMSQHRHRLFKLKKKETSAAAKPKVCGLVDFIIASRQRRVSFVSFFAFGALTSLSALRPIGRAASRFSRFFVLVIFV